jgi:hypothetical protein
VGEEVICSERDNYCKFKKPCSEITTLDDVAINININDKNGGTYLLAVQHADLLVSGLNFGDTDNTCYFAVFNS